MDLLIGLVEVIIFDIGLISLAALLGKVGEKFSPYKDVK